MLHIYLEFRTPAVCDSNKGNLRIGGISCDNHCVVWQFVIFNYIICRSVNSDIMIRNEKKNSKIFELIMSKV